jgi:hypothetical protein
MRHLIVLFISLISLSLFGQNNDVTKRIEYSVYSLEFPKAKEKLDNFILANQFEQLSFKETRDQITYLFKIKEVDISKIDSMVKVLGYVNARKINNSSQTLTAENLDIDLERLENKRQSYTDLLAKLDSSVSKEQYIIYWEKRRETEDQISNFKKEILKLKASFKVITVEIEIRNDPTGPTNRKVSWVHMPGLQYSVAFVEQPLNGISYAEYEGYALKYLFTKGKNYFALGAYKARNSNPLDSTSIDEIFNFTYGEDFYSRKFGRGNRHFFNPYIGYQLGFSLAYNKTESNVFPFLSPAFGIEWWKNKYFLFDTSADYYLPANALNRNLRAWRISASLNFVF